MKFWCILADTLPKSIPFLYSVNPLLSYAVQSVTGHEEEKKEIYVYIYVQKRTFFVSFHLQVQTFCLFICLFPCVSLPDFYEILLWFEGRQLCHGWIFFWNVELVTLSVEFLMFSYPVYKTAVVLFSRKHGKWDILLFLLK